MAETRFRLEERPYAKVSDSELLDTARDLTMEWFARPIESLNPEQRIRLATYLGHTRKTTVKQLSRVLCIPPERLGAVMRKR